MSVKKLRRAYQAARDAVRGADTPATATSSGTIQHLPAPGQPVWPAFPRELLHNAPWIFVVYLAFQAAWTPWQIIALLLALLPIAVLTSR